MIWTYWAVLVIGGVVGWYVAVFWESSHRHRRDEKAWARANQLALWEPVTVPGGPCIYVRVVKLARHPDGQTRVIDRVDVTSVVAGAATFKEQLDAAYSQAVDVAAVMNGTTSLPSAS